MSISDDPFRLNRAAEVRTRLPQIHSPVGESARAALPSTCSALVSSASIVIGNVEERRSYNRLDRAAVLRIQLPRIHSYLDEKTRVALEASCSALVNPATALVINQEKRPSHDRYLPSPVEVLDGRMRVGAHNLEKFYAIFPEEGAPRFPGVRDIHLYLHPENQKMLQARAMRAMARNFPDVRCLRVTYAYDALAEFVLSLPHLQQLHIRYPQFARMGDFLYRLHQNSGNLEIFIKDGTGLNDNDLPNLRLGPITSLSLNGDQITGNTFSRLTSCRRLQELILTRLTRFESRYLRDLTTLPALHSLSIVNTPWTLEALSSLAQATALRRLTLLASYHVKSVDRELLARDIGRESVFNALAGLKQLCVLRVDSHICPDDRSLLHLAKKMDFLRELIFDLYGTEISPYGIALALDKCPKMAAIVIRAAQCRFNTQEFAQEVHNYVINKELIIRVEKR